MKRQGSLRASDADRDRVIDRLRDAAGEGRLEPDELEQRVGAALRARTYAELSWLVADLPHVADRRGSHPRPVVRTALVAGGLAVATVVAVVVVAVLVIAAIALTATLWVIGLVLLIVTRGLRRRLAGPYPVGARRVRRARPAGFL
jgi:hypothetical protein